MSTRNIYQPHVYIARHLLPEHAPVETTTAIADFSITWGSDSWYENVDPAVLKITLIDPRGDLLGSAEGQSIRITRDPDEATVFEGTIDEVASRLIQTTHPLTGVVRDVWQHVMKASDPLAALARDRRRGPVYTSRDFTPARMHWGPCYMNERKNSLTSRLPRPISWESTGLDQFDGAKPIMIFPVPGYENSQVVSVLTVLRNTGRISHPLNRPYYLPSTGRYALVRPGAASFDTLHPDQYTSPPAIRLASSHTLIRGGDLSSDDGIASSTSARQLVTSVELLMRSTRPTSFVSTDTDRYMENVDVSHAYNFVPKAGNQLTAQLETDFSAAFFYSADEIRMSIQIWDHLSLTYGVAQLSPIKYQFDKHEPAPEWAVPWLTAEPPLGAFGRTAVYQLTDSLTNWIPGARPFSIPGGTLTYSDRRGWIAEVTPVAISARTPGMPKLGDVTVTTTLANVTDHSLIADWQHVTIVF